MKKVWIRSKDHGQSHSPGSAHGGGSPSLDGAQERVRQVRTALEIALPAHGFEVAPKFSPEVDLCICLGGDGSLLSTYRQLGEMRFRIPVLGIHCSDGLGFLYSVSAPAAAEMSAGFLANWASSVAQALADKRYIVESRWGLEGRVLDSSGQSRPGTAPVWALNDIVVSKGTLSRLVLLRLRADEAVLFQRMRGDGLIVSSATGSTGYALSAGGPVVQPTLNSIIVTPICPHEVAQRPIVLDGNTRLQVEILDLRSPCFVTSDGQVKMDVALNDSVDIRRSAEPIRWLRLNDAAVKSRNYFESLRSKLRYGGD